MLYKVIQSKHKSQIADTVNLFIHHKNDKNVKSHRVFLGNKIHRKELADRLDRWWEGETL